VTGTSSDSQSVRGGAPGPGIAPAAGVAAASGPPPGAPTICLGEVLVDFICERPIDNLTEADAFVPHLGRMVVITLGPEGAVLRGELRLDVPGRPAAVRSTIGAGDVLTGVLLARLATSGFYPSAVAASLPEAVAQSALACERWGALE